MRFRLFILIVLIFSACKEKTRTEYIEVSPAPSLPEKNTSNEVKKNSGVVDGSGGNIARTDFNEFKDIVENQLKYHLIDTTERALFYFEQIKDVRDIFGSPLDQIDPVVQKLFIDYKNRLDDLDNKLNFVAKEEHCVSSNHEGKSDAAINESGEMCFSYGSFKRFKNEALLKNLLIISMHELSHYIGYNEEQASVVQYFFEYQHGKHMILFNNSLFDEYFNYINQKTKDFNFIVSSFNKGLYKLACRSLVYNYLVNYRESKSYFLTPPSFFDLDIKEHSNILLENMNICEDVDSEKELTAEDKKKLFNSITLAASKRNEFINSFLRYIYPRLDLNNGVYSIINGLRPDFSEVKALERTDDNYNYYNPLDKKEVKCKLTDLAGKSVVQNSSFRNYGEGTSEYFLNTFLNSDDYGLTNKHIKKYFPDDFHYYSSHYGNINFSPFINYTKLRNSEGFIVSIHTTFGFLNKISTKEDYTHNHNSAKFFSIDGKFIRYISLFKEPLITTNFDHFLTPGVNTHIKKPVLLMMLKLSCEVN
tara:strand:+ start:157 stop:1758 length:1602 start_codon:yes stop_codon:yes gene_type:complete